MSKSENLPLTIHTNTSNTSNSTFTSPGTTDLTLNGNVAINGGLDLQYHKVSDPSASNPFIVTSDYYLIEIESASITEIQLPPASIQGQTFICYNSKSSGYNNLVVLPQTPDTISGSISFPLHYSGQQVQLISTGNSWLTI
jgi:hypothetical protein